MAFTSLATSLAMATPRCVWAGPLGTISHDLNKLNSGFDACQR